MNQNNPIAPVEVTQVALHHRGVATRLRITQSINQLTTLRQALLAETRHGAEKDEETYWIKLESTVAQLEAAITQLQEQIDVSAVTEAKADGAFAGAAQDLESLITRQRKALDTLNKQITSAESTLHKSVATPPPTTQHHGDVELQDINEFLQESPIATVPINASYYQRILEAARSPEGHRRPMGSILLKAEIITTRQLENALRHQREGQKRPLGSLLVDLGYTDDTAIAQAIAAQLALPFITLSQETVLQDALETIPLHVARRHGCFPVSLNDVGALYVAMANPLDLVALEDLRHASGRHVRPCVASRSEITDHINRHYAGSAF